MNLDTIKLRAQLLRAEYPDLDIRISDETGKIVDVTFTYSVPETVDIEKWAQILTKWQEHPTNTTTSDGRSATSPS